MKAGTIVLILIVACAVVAVVIWLGGRDEPEQTSIAEPVASEQTGSTDNEQDETPTTEPTTTVASTQPQETPDTHSRLEAQLKSSDPQARRQAIYDLSKEAEPDPVILAEALAEDPAPVVRAEAARSLARVESRTAVPELVEALDDEDLAVRSWAITALNNTCHMRFSYKADAPRQKRLQYIADIRRNLTNWGWLEE